MDTSPAPLTREQIYAIFQQVIAQLDTLSALRAITPVHMDQAFALGAQSFAICAQTLEMAGDDEGAVSFQRQATWLVVGQQGGRTAQDLFDLASTARRMAAERLPSFFHALHS